MKMKALIVALLVAVSSTVFGNDVPGMAVVSWKGSEVFKVIYQGATPGKVTMNILDTNGRKMHSKTFIGVDGFILPVNFKGLESGNYVIELVANEGKFQEKITYTPFFELKSIHVSKLIQDEGKFLLAVANAQNEPIYVTIFDETQQIVYNESKTVDGDFAQVYKLKNGARYTFEVSDSAGNRRYFKF
ncbi:MAG: hypothetical protein M3Y60_10655 [Bacteroidota bacterium]|nr:hypothetical protein [Bacteroidota bacterium]